MKTNNTYIKLEEFTKIIEKEKQSIPKNNDENVKKITLSVLEWLTDVIENIPKYELTNTHEQARGVV